MKAVEQIKDNYGNYLQLWGVYEIVNTPNTNLDLPYPVKSVKKKLLATYESLLEATDNMEWNIYYPCCAIIPGILLVKQPCGGAGVMGIQYTVK